MIGGPDVATSLRMLQDQLDRIEDFLKTNKYDADWVAKSPGSFGATAIQAPPRVLEEALINGGRVLDLTALTAKRK